MAFRLKRLRPGEEGARSALYDLEAEIMEVVWRHFYIGVHGKGRL